MTIYLDEVWLLNSVVDYLLLVLCGVLSEVPIRRGRILLAGAIGGGYAALSLVPGWYFLQNFFWKVVFAGLMCMVSFGIGKGLIQRGMILIILTAAFVGCVILLTELFSAPTAMLRGLVYYPMNLPVLVLTAGGTYGILRWSLERLSHHGGDIVPVELRYGDQKVQLTALRDTGNTLHDPISGEKVMVTDYTMLKRLKKEVEFKQEEFENPEIVLEKLYQEAPDMCPRLIPYKTIGKSRGMLLAIRPDEVKVEGNRERMMIAFSPVPVSDGGGYTALIGGTQ